MAVLYRAFVAPLLSRLENIVLFDLSEDAQVLSHGYIVSLAETDDLHRYRALSQGASVLDHYIERRRDTDGHDFVALPKQALSSFVRGTSYPNSTRRCTSCVQTAAIAASEAV